mgnify:CR=1 FL=1
MYDLLYAGFDTLDVAFTGSLPQETQSPVLVTIGPGNFQAHIAGHGMRGGYAFILNSAPLGAQFRFKNNTDCRQPNVFVSSHASALLAHGYHGMKEQLGAFDAIGATITGHTINRANFAMDFRTSGFEPRQD